MVHLHESWRRAWEGVGAGGGEPLREALIARYGEPHRAYHSVQHLQECLQWFERVGALAQHPAEVELALWFHDAVYDVRRHDNEERSAELARASLLAAGVDAARAGRVAALVLATRHDAAPTGIDEQVLVDIDLAILGAGPARFAEDDRQIRQEYAFVPLETYLARRREVLRSFLDRPRLYATEPMYAALDQAARRNLRQAIDQP